MGLPSRILFAMTCFCMGVVQLSFGVVREGDALGTEREVQGKVLKSAEAGDLWPHQSVATLLAVSSSGSRIVRTRVVDGLWHVSANPGEKLFPCGLVCAGRSYNLVMGGAIGGEDRGLVSWVETDTLVTVHLEELNERGGDNPRFHALPPPTDAPVLRPSSPEYTQLPYSVEAGAALLHRSQFPTIAESNSALGLLLAGDSWAVVAVPAGDGLLRPQAGSTGGVAIALPAGKKAAREVVIVKYEAGRMVGTYCRVRIPAETRSVQLALMPPGKYYARVGRAGEEGDVEADHVFYVKVDERAEVSLRSARNPDAVRRVEGHLGISWESKSPSIVVQTSIRLHRLRSRSGASRISNWEMECPLVRSNEGSLQNYEEYRWMAGEVPAGTYGFMTQPSLLVGKVEIVEGQRGPIYHELSAECGSITVNILNGKSGESVSASQVHIRPSIGTGDSNWLPYMPMAESEGTWSKGIVSCGAAFEVDVIADGFEHPSVPYFLVASGQDVHEIPLEPAYCATFYFVDQYGQYVSPWNVSSSLKSHDKRQRYIDKRVSDGAHEYYFDAPGTIVVEFHVDEASEKVRIEANPAIQDCREYEVQL